MEKYYKFTLASFYIRPNVALIIQILMRTNFCFIGPNIPVIKHWYNAIELCIQYYVSNNEEKVEFFCAGKELDIITKKLYFKMNLRLCSVKIKGEIEWEELGKKRQVFGL